MTIQDFKIQYDTINQDVLQMKKRSNIYALLRFFLMIGVIVDLLVGYFQEKYILYSLSLVFLILFMVLVVIHQKLKDGLKYKLAQLDVYNEHIQRMSFQWDEFKENGSSFINEKDYCSLDLDVFGHHSLFQMINVAFTQKGKERLAYYLKGHEENVEHLLKRQEAVQELTQSTEFVIEMQTYGKMSHNQKETLIQNFIDSIELVKLPKVSKVFMILPLISFLSIICLILSIGYPYSYIVCEVVVFLQIAIAFLQYGKHSQILEPVSKLSHSLKSYSDIFELINKQKFKSELLCQIQQQTIYENRALQGIKSLSSLADRISYRQNLFAFIILNGLGLYDYWVRNQYLDWLKTYSLCIDKWFSGLSEIEVLMSLSILKIDNFDVTMPCIEDKQCLSFQNLRHPLILSEKVVGNDFMKNHQTCIITGSNMSGKTTFMRSIGLNLVLAYAGGYTFSNQMSCSLMHVMTSMRVKDNVEEGVSTFYGELLRIKDMIEYSSLNHPVICFIDEIFKGTNSLDRIAGAKATIEKLSNPNCLTFLTTHDFELCEIDKLIFDNYHFDEYYKDNQIYFDYCIKKGRSESTNGQFLLKQLGIISENENE